MLSLASEHKVSGTQRVEPGELDLELRAGIEVRVPGHNRIPVGLTVADLARAAEGRFVDEREGLVSADVGTSINVAKIDLVAALLEVADAIAIAGARLRLGRSREHEEIGI